MQRPDHELQTRIKACESPTFGYRRGEDGEIEKDIFDGEIPDGWVDSPAKVDKARDVVPVPFSTKSTTVPRTAAGMWTFDDEATEIPVSPSATPESEVADETPAKPYEDHKFNVLKTELKRRTGKGPKAGTSKAAVIGRLKDLDTLNQ